MYPAVRKDGRCCAGLSASSSVCIVFVKLLGGGAPENEEDTKSSEAARPRPLIFFLNFQTTVERSATAYT